MKNIFNFIKVSPDAPPITNQDEISRDYRYWRKRVLYTTTIGYSIFYLVRKGLSVALPVIRDEYSIDESDLGLILTIFGVTYGVSKFINGFIGDKTNPRYFMAIGLFGSAIINIFFGFSGALWAFALFWFLNGIFQGMGWAPCSRTLVQWFSAKERGVNFSICNTSVGIGAVLLFILNGYLIDTFCWQACFFVPAGIAILGSIFIAVQLRDRPQSLGLPPVEEYANDQPDIRETEKGKDVTYTHDALKYIFRNPMMWVLCLGNFFVYSVRYGIADWGVTFLKDAKGLEISKGVWLIAGYEGAGVAGMLLGGWVMDRFFKGFGGRTCALYMFLCTLSVLIFWQFPIKSIPVNILLFCMMGFFIYGPQCLVAVVAANMVPKKLGAAAIGITGLFGYLSTILSGWGLGTIKKHYGWDKGFLMLAVCAGLGAVVFLFLWRVGSHLPNELESEISCET